MKSVSLKMILQPKFYLQLVRLVELRAFCETVKDDKGIKSQIITENEWSNVNILISILKPYFIFTQKLQSESCTLSDFYGYWLKIDFDLNRAGIDDMGFGTFLIGEMERYKPMLLQIWLLCILIHATRCR